VEEEGGLNREYVCCRTETKVHANIGNVEGPSTSCAPLQLSLYLMLTIPGDDCCLVVDNVENKKDVVGGVATPAARSSRSKRSAASLPFKTFDSEMQTEKRQADEA
jgi:hypothetical protein